MTFGVLVDLVDVSTVWCFGGFGGHDHWRQSCCWRPSFGGFEQRAGGGGGTRQEGRGWDWTAGQPILREPAPLSSPVHLCPISPPALTPLASPWSCRAPAPLLALLACTCGPRRLQSGWCSYYPAVLYFMNRKEAAAARTDAESLQECQLPADHQYFSHLIISISIT